MACIVIIMQKEKMRLQGWSSYARKGTVVDYEASEIKAVLPRDYLELLD